MGSGKINKVPSNSRTYMFAVAVQRLGVSVCIAWRMKRTSGFMVTWKTSCMFKIKCRIFKLCKNVFTEAKNVESSCPHLNTDSLYILLENTYWYLRKSPPAFQMLKDHDSLVKQGAHMSSLHLKPLCSFLQDVNSTHWHARDRIQMC